MVVSVLVSYGGSGKRGRFFAQLAPAGNRLRLVGEMKRPGITAPAHIHSIYSWGRLGRCPKLPCKLTPEPHFTALLADAEVICKQMLSRAPSHATCLNLLGVVYQASACHRLAIKLFAKLLQSTTWMRAFITTSRVRIRPRVSRSPPPSISRPQLRL